MTDPARLERIDEILRQAGVDIDGLASNLREAISKEYDLSRRQLMSRTEAAFREGFLTGKKWPKFAPYAADAWRKSEFYRRHFARKPERNATDERYAKFNDT